MTDPRSPSLPPVEALRKLLVRMREEEAGRDYYGVPWVDQLERIEAAIPSPQTWQPQENEHAGGSLNGPSRLGASPNTDTGGECVLVPRSLVDLTLELLKQTRLGLHGTPWAQGEIRQLVDRLSMVASPRGGPAQEPTE